jgi:hypothetical protein
VYGWTPGRASGGLRQKAAGSDEEEADDEDGVLGMLPQDFDPAVFDLDEINDLLTRSADEDEDED